MPETPCPSARDCARPLTSRATSAIYDGITVGRPMNVARVVARIGSPSARRFARRRRALFRAPLRHPRQGPRFGLRGAVSAMRP